MRLVELQRRFQAEILDAAPPDATDLGLAIPVRIGVHHSHFWTRMREFIANWQPLLAKFLGADELDAVVRRYVVAHPPTSVNPSDACTHLAQFLGTTAPWSEFPVIGALAAFDLQRMLVGASAEEITVTAAKLAAVDPDVLARVRFRLKKRAALMITPLKFDVPRLPLLARTTPLDARPTYRLVHLVDRRYATLELDHRTYRAFEPLVAGVTFAELTDHLRSLELTEPEIARFRDLLVDQDLLVAIE